jgi:hypothetical protein
MEGVEEAWAGIEQGRILAADVWPWLVLELVADLGVEASGLWQIETRMAWASLEMVVHETVLGAPAAARVIRCKRIYIFLCSMLVLHQLLCVLFILRGICMHFPELTY